MLGLWSSQAKLRVNNSLLNLFKHLVSEFAQCFTHILNVLLYDLLQEGGQFEQGGIGGVLEPGLDENAVVGLQHEVFSNIIHNYTLIQRSAYLAKVFDKYHACWRGVLPVKSVGDTLLFVDLVEHPVCVVLHGCSEDNHLVDLAHLFEEFIASRSDAEGAFSTDFVIVHQGLV